MNCPKCHEDITDSYEPDDPSVGLVGGWYCEVCDHGVAEWECERKPMEGDVPISFIDRGKPMGTPLSELSGRPGHPGFAKFCRIAKSWGYD